MHFKTKRNIIFFKKKIKEMAELIVGTAIIAIATCLFLLPNKISTGGFSGLGTIFYYLFKIPIGTAVFALNIPIFIMAYIKIGRSFFYNAVIGTVLLSVFLNLFERLTVPTSDRFLACIYGGIISGIGTAITLKANGSTGGSELLANIISRYKKDLKISNIIVIIDIIIVFTNVIVFKDIEIGLYSAITIFLSGKMLDIFFEGINFAKMLLIISPIYEEISFEINSKIRRGTTAIKAVGMYKKQERTILLSVASRQEIREIRKLVNEIDPKAFIIITNAREVFGEGFK